MSKFLLLLLSFSVMASTPPVPVPPGGLSNTFTYFNSSGKYSSNANDRLDATNGRAVISTLGTGSTTGNIGVGSSGFDALVIGSSAGASSILSSNFGTGMLTVGNVASSGQVSTQGNGSIVGGNATNSGIVATELNGGISVGTADSSGQVSANGEATQAFGHADGTGAITGANGSGSAVFGWATGTNSTINTTTSKFGQLSGGYAATAGNITTGANGGISWGYADTGGSISGAGDGSIAVGRSHGNSINVTATGVGAVAFGYANNNSLTASANGAMVGGSPTIGGNTASGASSIVWGDGNTGSGSLSFTQGLGNSNGSYAAWVGGRYASLSSQTAGSWVSSDFAIVYGNGASSGSKANAFSVDKSGNIIAAGTLQTASGSVGSPSHSFSSDTSTGMFLVGSHDLGLTVNGAQAMDFQKSTGGFGNVGMGGSASLSDGYPLLLQRTNASAGTLVQVSNATAAANSHATFQVSTDSNNIGNISVYTTGSTVDAYKSAMVIRPNGDTLHLSLTGGEGGTANVQVYTAGDYTNATGLTAVFNSDHTTKFYGPVIIPVQAGGATPSTTVDGATAYTSAHILCVYNGSAWKKAADGSTACTF